MVELSPKRMCALLSSIEGTEALEEYEFCRDAKVPLEQ
jgi:hypothetical protein